jgi:hypothetical protein
MVTRQDTKVAARLKDIPKLLDVCEQVGKALVETGQEWWASGFFAPTTDFQRVRDKSMAELCTVERDLQKIRSTAFSPEAIRATTYVRTLLQACQDCHEANQESIEQGTGFTCLAREHLGSQNGSNCLKPDAHDKGVE